MKVSLIIAVSENQVIGKNNDLVWHLPEDMKFFKKTTEAHFVIMGRKNFESIPHKYRPLPNRTNVIVTRQSSYEAEGCVVVRSIIEAIEKAKEAGDTEPFIIGGGEIYRHALENDLIDRVYLTRVHENFDGDTFFPKLGTEWKLISSKKKHADDKHFCDFTYEIYEKEAL
ncbi:MAG: dihydrofolate reductase [Flavobacteriales bacterium]|nr:dihydrofolate reductase [Flavobacteriales bacterium]